MFNFKKNEFSKTLSYNLVDTNIEINTEIFDFLKKKIAQVDIVRVCLHSTSEELTQSMIIAINKTVIIAPHKNQFKNKFYHILEGEMELNLIDREKITLKEGAFFKLEKNTFASMTSLSEICIYNEIIAGPFQPTDTIYNKN